MAGGSGGRRACLRSVAGLLMAIGVVLLSTLLVVPSDSLQGGMSAMIKALPAGTRTALIKAGVVHAEVVSVASRSDANSVEASAASSFPEQGSAAAQSAAREVEPASTNGVGQAASARQVKTKRRAAVCSSHWYASSEDAFCVCPEGGDAFLGSWLEGVSRARVQRAVKAGTGLPRGCEAALRAGVTDFPPADASRLPAPLRHVIEPASAKDRLTDDGRCLRLGPAPCPPILQVPQPAAPEDTWTTTRAKAMQSKRRRALAHAVESGMPTVLRGVLPQNPVETLMAGVGLWQAGSGNKTLFHMRKQRHPVFVLRQSASSPQVPLLDELGGKAAPPRTARDLHLPWEGSDASSSSSHATRGLAGGVPAAVLGEGHVDVGGGDRDFFYHTGTVSDWAGEAPAHISRRLQEATEELQTAFGMASSALLEEVSDGGRATGGAARLWTGQAGVTAQTHYDHVRNAFIQLQGFKRVVLYPPAAASDLHPFPHIHPSYHQSQVPPTAAAALDETSWAALPVFTAAANAFNTSATWGEELATRRRQAIAVQLAKARQHLHAAGVGDSRPKDCAPACCSLRRNTVVEPADAPGNPEGSEADLKKLYGSYLAMEVVLEPGDVLFIPPMWFHRITALSPSQSLSVVSASPVDILSSRAMWTELPLQGALDNPVARALLAQAMLARLFELLQPFASGDSAFVPHAHGASTSKGGVRDSASVYSAIPESPTGVSGTSLPGRDVDIQVDARARVSDEVGRLMLARWLPLYAQSAPTQRSLRRTLAAAGTARPGKAVPHPAVRLLQAMGSRHLTCPAQDAAAPRSGFSCFRHKGRGGKSGSPDPLLVRPLTQADSVVVDTVRNITELLPAIHAAAERVADWLTYSAPVRGDLPAAAPAVDWFDKAHWDSLRFEHSAAGMVTGTALQDLMGGDRVQLSPGQVRLLLWDYAEELAQWAMGDCNVPAFFRECLWRQDGWFPAGSSIAAL